MKYLLAALLAGTSLVARAQVNGVGTYSPAYYRDLELKSRSPEYARRVHSTVNYEVKNIKKFLLGTFSAYPAGGFSYSIANTSQYAEVLTCDFLVIFKNESGRVVGTVRGNARSIKPGTQASSDNIKVFSLPPVGKTITQFVFNKVASE